MTTRNVSLLLAVVLCSISLHSAPVTVDRARQVAENFLRGERSHTPGVKRSLSQSHPTSRTVLEDQQFYLFDTEDGGFVIISADDCARPILAYGDKGWPTGNDKTQKMPDNLRNWLEGYNSSIRKAVADGYTASEATRNEWTALAASAKAEATPVVEPMIQTTWNQQQEYLNVQTTYNRYTPEYIHEYEGEYGTEYYPTRVPVGCVATCMAQVMNYWQWPKKGTGSHSYTPFSHPEYGVQSANFGATTYDWAHMPKELTYDGSTETEINAVAKLMYHCGVATNMDYSPEGSGTYATNYWKVTRISAAAYALSTYFGYSNTLESYFRQDFVNDDDWFDLLKEELNAGRPLMYAGGDNNGNAHSFVCDGYDSQNYFHFNFGWGGSYDGYFSCDAITPGGSGTGGNSSHNYSYTQDVIVGIRPAASASESAYDHALRLIDDPDFAPELDKDSLWFYYDTLFVSLTILNADSLNYEGEVAAQVIDEQGRVVCTSAPVNLSINGIVEYEDGMISYYWNFADLEILPSLILTPGNYHVQPVYRNAAGAWTPIESRHFWSQLAFTVYHWADIFAYSEMTVTPDPLVQGRLGKVIQNIANVTGKALNGIFYAALYTEDGTYVQELGEVDLAANPLDNYTYTKYTFKDTVKAAPGNYALILLYWDESGNTIVGSDLHAAARMVTVISEEEAPEPDPEYHIVVNSFIAQNAQTGALTIYEGDTIGAYVDLKNIGNLDYSGYLLMELYNAEYQSLIYNYYNLNIGAGYTAFGNIQVDTTLTAGDYYLVLYSYNAAEDVWDRLEDGDATSIIAFTVSKQSHTGMENVAESKVRIYPNPAVDHLSIEGADVRHWSLYDLSGRLIKGADGQTNKISMDGMPAGEYILILKEAKGEASSHRIQKR